MWQCHLHVVNDSSAPATRIRFYHLWCQEKVCSSSWTGCGCTSIWSSTAEAWLLSEPGTYPKTRVLTVDHSQMDCLPLSWMQPRVSTKSPHLKKHWAGQLLNLDPALSEFHCIACCFPWFWRILANRWSTCLLLVTAAEEGETSADGAQWQLSHSNLLLFPIPAPFLIPAPLLPRLARAVHLCLPHLGWS